ncbi:MAG: ParB N-terminal domain-containing protein [Pseudomonadota bacterium]
MASKWPDIQRVTSADDFEKIQFVEDMAMIEVPVECLDNLPFKNADRSKSARLRAVEKAIRIRGYDSLQPIIVRLGRRGRWVIVDGGHRVTAARRVAKEFFTNLFGKKVRNLHFLLYQTPLSNTRLDDPEDPDPGDDADELGSLN